MESRLPPSLGEVDLMPQPEVTLGWVLPGLSCGRPMHETSPEMSGCEKRAPQGLGEGGLVFLRQDLRFICK